MRNLAGCLLLSGLALAACGGGAAPTTSPSAAAGSLAASKPAATGSASASASAPASAVAKPSAAAAAGSIKIGHLEPLTGPLADIGKDLQDGFNLYFDSLGNTVAGRKLEILTADTEGKADVGLTKAKALVENQGAQVLAGITSSAVCAPVAQYVKEAQVPLAITGNCGAEGITKVGAPYTTRFTQNHTEVNDVAADAAIKAGYKKAILLTSDYTAGIENSDFFASAFIARGGTVVQEIHPPMGTADFGPHLAQLTSDADVIFEFLPGVDALRFMQQYGDYAGSRKLKILDDFASITAGPNLAQLKTKAVGVTSVMNYTTALPGEANQNFLKQWAQKYPDRLVSANVAMGYTGAQILEAAIKKVNGNVQDKQQFLNALYDTNIEAAKGPIKLDKEHDIIQNMYVFDIVPDNQGGTAVRGTGVAEKLTDTYKALDQFWDRTADQIQKFQYGKLKGKWVGMTKQQLGDVVTLPKS